jgi:ATP synthase protein I
MLIPAAPARNVQQYWKGLGGPGTVGIEIVLSVAVGLLGGSWLDKKFGTAPWLTGIGLAYGLAAAARAIYRALKESRRELEAIERKEQQERKKFDDDQRRNDE